MGKAGAKFTSSSADGYPLPFPSQELGPTPGVHFRDYLLGSGNSTEKSGHFLPLKGKKTAGESSQNPQEPDTPGKDIALFCFLERNSAETTFKTQPHLKGARSLSKIRRIYCGCAGFGQIFRSFSLNRPHYSPQTIEKSDSNQHTLATIANLGQAPRTVGSYSFPLSLEGGYMLYRNSFFQYAVGVLVATPILWGLMATSAIGDGGHHHLSGGLTIGGPGDS